MSLDHRLIDLLVCPLCKGPLQMARSAEGLPTELQCGPDRLAFPIRDGIPIMLESEARSIEPAEPPPPPLSLSPVTDAADGAGSTGSA